MKIVRLVLGVLAGMIVITIVVESIEFLIVKSVSGKSMNYLSSNQSAYFEIRNQAWILVLKLIYTFLAAILAGWLGSKITKDFQSIFFIASAVLQSLAFFFAMFFSEFKETLALYYWFLLLIIVLSGIYIGKNSNKNLYSSNF